MEISNPSRFGQVYGLHQEDECEKSIVKALLAWHSWVSWDVGWDKPYWSILPVWDSQCGLLGWGDSHSLSRNWAARQFVHIGHHCASRREPLSWMRWEQGMSPMWTCGLANMWHVMWHESIRFSFLLKFVLIDAMKYVASHCVQMQHMASVYTTSESRLWIESSTGLIDLRDEPSWGAKASRQVTWPGKPSGLVRCVPLLSRHI